MSTSLDSMKPGQTIKVSVTKSPRRPAQIKTIERLMRQDVSAKRALASAQGRRRLITPIRTRGGRRWYVRLHPAKIVRVENGASWEMTYIPHLAGEFRSVEKFLDIKTA